MSLNPAQLAAPPGGYACVFDVGADVGSFATACLEAWPECVVHSFEPLRSIANLVEGGRWHWHRVAIGDSRGAAPMWKCEFSPSSSLLEMAELHKTAFPYTEQNELLDVRVERLDQYDDLIAAPALLKLDVQGYELNALIGAGAALELFHAVVLETSHAELYHGAADAELLAGFLEDAGFRHHSRVDEMRHPDTDELLQSDELWVRA